MRMDKCKDQPNCSRYVNSKMKYKGEINKLKFNNETWRPRRDGRSDELLLPVNLYKRMWLPMSNTCGVNWWCSRNPSVSRRSKKNDGRTKCKENLSSWEGVKLDYKEMQSPISKQNPQHNCEFLNRG